MTDTQGKGRTRKSPMEGFSNVPKILEEARLMVDEVTQTGKPAEAGETTMPVAPEGQIGQPATPEPTLKPKKTAVKRAASRVAKDSKAPAVKKPRTKPAPGLPASETALATDARPPDQPAPTTALPPEKFGIHIIHRVRGRTRLKLRHMKYNAPLARSLEDRMTIVPGIIAVETSTLTGRAVFYYNPGEVSQPYALTALQEAWQDLFPGLQAEKLVSEMTCQ